MVGRSGARAAVRSRGRRIRHLQDFQGPRPIGKAANEAALFQSHDQPVNPDLEARFRASFISSKRRRNAIGLNPFVNKEKQLFLLGCEHGIPPGNANLFLLCLFSFCSFVKFASQETHHVGVPDFVLDGR